MRTKKRKMMRKDKWSHDKYNKLTKKPNFRIAIEILLV